MNGKQRREREQQWPLPDTRGLRGRWERGGEGGVGRGGGGRQESLPL